MKTQIKNKNQGSRYEETKNFDLKEIAKLVRKDIGKVFSKDFKFSITIERYSGGQSLNISVKESPKNYINIKRIKDEFSNEFIFTKEGFEILDKIKKIVDKYNYDNSDSQTDYFDVRFYSNIIFDFDLVSKWRKEVKEMLKNEYNLSKQENTPDQDAILSELKEFTGTESYHKSTFGKLNLTDGMDFLRNNLNCYWLIDIIESVQNLKEIQENKEFILWKIEVKDGGFKVTARSDTNTPILYEQKGGYTDFSLKEFEFYQVGDVLLLKSEY